MEDIICSLNIGLNCLHRKEFARRDLLECSGMENVIYTRHSISDRAWVSDIANVKLDLLRSIRMLCLQHMPHVILFLLIAAENADLPDISL